MPDRLRALWDFDDLDLTEQRLRGQLAEETDDPGRAEVLSQLARIEGLRGSFDAGELLIDEAASRAGDDRVVLARIDLERGRLRRSSGDEEAALPLFESAYRVALEADEPFHAADAAHMMALVAPGGFEQWTTRGIALAGAHEEARHWLGPLLNNLGWHHYERGEHGPALDAFERALTAREANPQDPESIEIARYAVGKALRALGRSEDAVPLLEQAVAWASGRGKPDGWFHEELAEDYSAIGRDDDAREQARLAVPLLLEADPSFIEGEGRTERLRALAGDQP
jgi:tetratricopeptide (TPR) repeat protein